jgi:hypothetical protein
LHRKGAVLPSLSSISDSGVLSGFFFQQPKGYLRGFIKHGHHVRVIDAPKAGHKLGEGTLLLNATNPHAICGDVVHKNHHVAGFVDYRGHAHTIDIHPSKRKAYTEVFACNSHGVIGGHVANRHGKSPQGFVSKVH